MTPPPTRESGLNSETAREHLYEIIRGDAPFEDKARDALELGRRYLGMDNGHLTRIDQETDHWEAIVSTDSPDGRFPPGLELGLETTYCRRTIGVDSQITLHDAPNQGWADDPAFETHGLHCYHGTTLILEDEPYGTVCFVAAEPREPFTDGETLFVELIARLLERELEREHHEAQLLRQTNLATVLNRILRHNLRNDMSIIRGFTQLLAEKSEEHPYEQTVLEKIDKLIELCRKARELDRIVAAGSERELTDIPGLVENIVETVTQQYPNASVTVEYDEDITTAVFPNFERALEELIENAVKHSGEAPTVTVSIEAVPNAVEIWIADNGPGLASHEADVLETGTETPLTHGTGLGLWLSHWIVTGHDGSLDATVTDDGTTMTISIPRKPLSNARQVITKFTQARDQYLAAFNAANDAMILINDGARIIDANPEASFIYGLDQQALLGQPFQRFLPDEFDFDAAWSQFKDAGQDRDTVTIVGADGVERRVEYSATTDIVPGQHLVVSRDVTERNERERQLQLFRRAVEASGHSIYFTDRDGVIEYVNPAFEEMTGYTADEAIGMTPRILKSGEHDDRFYEKQWSIILSGETCRSEVVNKTKTGDRYIVDQTIAPIENEDGEITHFVAINVDITDQRERERAIEQQND